ncbi:neutral ceramidase-like [Pogonomyrmex barbatus]|uniref:Neutral ceramidase-like n=1 Tax=Pogonomyrmex barbatus TaxID=144034 RepID=A0A6I9VUK6_9HYME|nr:neutral ceramidase-like [Pogonomyrmex barbatus]
MGYMCVFRFQWERTSKALKSSQVTITWEIPQDVKPGEYRIRHNGYFRYFFTDAYPYYGVTNHFQVEIPAMK